MKTILISLLIVFTISIGVGFVVADFIGFWQGAVAACIIQFIAFYFTTSKPKEEEEPIEDQLIELQTASIACPCGKHIFSAPIFLNSENPFTCEKCGSRFRVEMSYESVVVTEPLNIENVFNHLKDKGTQLSS